MSWAQRLKRVKLDLGTCEGCRSQVRVIASVEGPLVIAMILKHLDRREVLPGQRPAMRGPPPGGREFG